MTDRAGIERLLQDMYAARIRGDLPSLTDAFATDAVFHIAGASNASPLTVTATGVNEFRPLLGIMIKSFKLSDFSVLSQIIDGNKAAVHWRVKIFSRITGTTTLTELMDVLEVREGRIGAYTEFFAPH